MRKSKVAVVVLAAGESTRMGELKQLLPFGGSAILEQVVANLLESEVSEIIVILGYQADKIAPRLMGWPVKIALNPDFHQGISSSIRCGLSHLPKGADAIMLFLGDQPLIGKEIINRLVAAFQEGQYGIIVPVYKGKKGHPVIFDLKYEAELSSLEGDIGAKSIIEAHPEAVLEVEVNSGSILIDIDSKEEYEALQNRQR